MSRGGVETRLLKRRRVCAFLCHYFPHGHKNAQRRADHFSVLISRRTSKWTLTIVVLNDRRETVPRNSQATVHCNTVASSNKVFTIQNSIVDLYTTFQKCVVWFSTALNDRRFRGSNGKQARESQVDQFLPIATIDCLLYTARYVLLAQQRCEALFAPHE